MAKISLTDMFSILMNSACAESKSALVKCSEVETPLFHFLSKPESSAKMRPRS